jgi:hypothetical protein
MSSRLGITIYHKLTGNLQLPKKLDVSYITRMRHVIYCYDGNKQHTLNFHYDCESC